MCVILFGSSIVEIMSVNSVDDNIVSQGQKFGYVIKPKKLMLQRELWMYNVKRCFYVKK